MYWNEVATEKNKAKQYSWIVTLDVLKLPVIAVNRSRIKLNSNIRCIEIHTAPLSIIFASTLNSNIRCIEMLDVTLEEIDTQSWIVTLDVLKL